jgi:hypothetical protein
MVGKTKYEGTRFTRRYRCLDCGAVTVCSGDIATREYVHRPLLELVK